MAKFEPKYSNQDFLDVLKGGELRTLGGIAKLIGCARMTAITYMDNLVKCKMVEKLAVDDGQLYVYKIKN
jgi:DNA-binding IclR family transcriptional regulator